MEICGKVWLEQNKPLWGGYINSASHWASSHHHANNNFFYNSIVFYLTNAKAVWCGDTTSG